MGTKGPLAIVSPADFKSRTALTLSSRSGTTQAVDRAYEAYYDTRSPAAAKVLHDRLAEYMLAHGGSWAKCERNTVSGGLMEYIYHSVAANALSPGQARAMDERAAARIRDIEIPSARFGVLYFLSGIKIDLDVVGALIDGAGAIGGAVGVGMTTDFGQMKSAANGVRAVTSVNGVPVKAQSLATVGTAALHGTRMVGNKIMDGMSGPSVPGPSWLPCTEAALDAASRKLSETWDANHYVGALAYAGAGLAAVPTAAVTLTADALLAIKRLAEATWRKIKAAVDAVCMTIKSAWASRYDLATARRLGEILKKAAVVAVDYIMKNAIPYLGGAIDLGTGLFRTISEAGTRLAAWNDRRHIRLQAGHPEELANAIEHQMSLGILGGVADMLKGATKVAVGVFLPGLGSLVSAVMSGIEWLVRLVSRLGEYFGIQQFLQVARRHYTAEKQRARKGADGVYEPNTAAGGIITDTAAFTTFFREGCKASPLIPMLTLNSGLGGSLMTMLQLFEADGRQSARATRNLAGGETREFDRGDMYFMRLKRWSVEYMRKSGFKFLPADPKDTLMAGYLAHATGLGKERQSHVEAGNAMGRVGAFLTA